ncbi:RNA-binding domain-containing protein [uncultured Methanolobus sp.]|uniref:RNA-binding domain-containing protein n=1 Tax=uncultured Methanolobus sp. TaxID=218300 RepID=UPI0029C63F56|nr:RNA-binding domain-containing protein [uncultured Methanolobus sp.]
MDSDNYELDHLLSQGETLTIEFKSDLKSLPDRDLVAAVVSLANTEGGNLLIGVEDDGTITGVHKNHTNSTGLASLIANKTNPPLSVRVYLFEVEEGGVVCIHVPKSRQLVSTSEGLLQRRRIMADGKPEAVPFYPHEFAQRQASMGLLDISSTPVTSLSEKELNPLERHRIREAIRRYGGDTSLLPLADEELDSALGLVTNINGIRHPTIAGLLFLGREEILRQHVPAHEIAFQVLEGTDVRVNEFFRKPLLQTFEEIEKLFSARVMEKEIQVGLYRVPVPNFERRAFREAFVNALVHRDYSRLGAVHVRLDDDGMTISSPGGFVEGVNLQNLLVTEPRPRNPLLADIAKRIGLAERTGRGIDRIFEGVLRYGRTTPDYSRSDSNSVILRLSNAEADMDFLQMILRQEQLIGRTIPLSSLIILSRLRQERRLTTADLSSSIQKSEHETRSIIEKLVESGLVEAHGTKRGRTYTLSAKVYVKSGEKAEYVRQAGFDTIQQEQMVLSYISKHGSIKRADVMDLCMIDKDQAYRLLHKLKENRKIIQIGRSKGTFYVEKK